jgi:predicted DNA-binding transcriptional regulator YafY
MEAEESGDPMSKARIVKLLNLLREETDSQHVLNASQLIGLLQAQGEEAARKSIYDDIRLLQECGYAIEMVHQGQQYGYYFDDQLFAPAEVKIVTDAIRSSYFLPKDKTAQLQDKLLGLCNRYDRRLVQANLSYQGNKAANEHIYYHIDALMRAIAARRAVTFDYYDYGPDQKRKRRRSERYRQLPLTLLWMRERYYLVACSPTDQRRRNFRIDRMEQIEAEDYHGVWPRLDDLNEYVEGQFQMFGGQKVTVTLRCAPQLANEVHDAFGDQAIWQDRGPDGFTVNVPVQLSPTFYAWLFQWGGQVAVLAPQSVKEEYRKRCLEAAGKEKV